MTNWRDKGSICSLCFNLLNKVNDIINLLYVSGSNSYSDLDFFFVRSIFSTYVGDIGL